MEGKATTAAMEAAVATMEDDSAMVATVKAGAKVAGTVATTVVEVIIATIVVIGETDPTVTTVAPTTDLDMEGIETETAAILTPTAIAKIRMPKILMGKGRGAPTVAERAGIDLLDLLPRCRLLGN